MKTVEEFYKEFEGSEALRNELKTAYNDALAAFLKKHGCDADAEEFTAFIKMQTEGEIGDDEAETAAGGSRVLPPDPLPPIIPII